MSLLLGRQAMWPFAYQPAFAMMASSAKGGGTIMERGDIETLLNDVYAARARNDVAAIVGLSTPDIHYQMAGSAETFVTTKADGREEFGALLASLVKTFELIDYKIQGMTIDGSNATVHWLANFRSSVTGQTAETEIVDVIRFCEGRIASILEFCDTALATRLMGL